MDEASERQFIQSAVASIEKTMGERPYGWLSRYLLTENTRRLLAEEGFTYHMDDYSDDLPFWNTDQNIPMVIMPYALDSNDMKMWTDPSYSPEAWLKYAVDTFDWLVAEGEAGSPKMMSLGVHLRIIGRPGRIGAFDAFLSHVTSRDDIWIATRKNIRDRWAQANPAP
jgi:hypothetical protein